MARRRPICRPATQLSHMLTMALWLALFGCTDPQNAPSASIDKAPLAAPNKAPSASPNKEPSAATHKEPSAPHNEKPIASPNKEPSASGNEKPLASSNKEPSTPTHKALAAAQFSGRNALRHIAAQAALGPRSPYHPRAKARTLDYIEAHLKPLTTRIARQPFVRHG